MIGAMYKVIVVDDEPTALNHVCTILQKKCPDFVVVGTACNGVDALKKIEDDPPDVLITDVQMPIMDGIALVMQVKAQYPDILLVIASGYFEFDYAKKAMQTGVCDYLLKPLKPTDIQQMMQKLTVRLDAFYYQKRNAILRALCRGEPLASRLQQYFPAGRYYAAIMRRNGLPKRFSSKMGVEIYAMAEEQLYIYGRDEMESLYVFPDVLVFRDDFRAVTRRLFDKNNDGQAYVTMIAFSESFELASLSTIANKLYRKLDEAIVIGKSQLVFDHMHEAAPSHDAKTEKDLLEKTEHFFRHNDGAKVQAVLQQLFGFWAQQQCGQLHVESRVRYCFEFMMSTWMPDADAVEIAYLIDDAFYYATTMEELAEHIANIVNLCMPDTTSEKQSDKAQLFQDIIGYLDKHVAHTITISSICRTFGVSQTTLSKMFRTYENTSFGSYLTNVRISKAQSYIKSDTQAYIKDIAERVGYADQFYFSRIFRSVTGMSPSEYMNTINPDEEDMHERAHF